MVPPRETCSFYLNICIFMTREDKSDSLYSLPRYILSIWKFVLKKSLWIGIFVISKNKLNLHLKLVQIFHMFYVIFCGLFHNWEEGRTSQCVKQYPLRSRSAPIKDYLK